MSGRCGTELPAAVTEAWVRASVACAPAAEAARGRAMPLRGIKYNRQAKKVLSTQKRVLSKVGVVSVTRLSRGQR